MTNTLTGFDWQPRTRLVFGVNSLESLGTLTAELGARHALIVTDKGIVAAGHVERAVNILHKHDIRATVFDEVHENPTTEDVDRCLQVARENEIEVFIGLGGGSSLDTAKGCNFLLTNGGEMRDYWGVGKATKPMLPLIAVPTTAGTGSECQSAALIADAKTHQKMACLDPKAAAKIALLDPILTLTQPRNVTACTGMDAIVHSIETAVSTKRSPISQVFSIEAFRLMVGTGAFEKVLQTPEDLEARSKMLLGAAYAGTAIELSMLGAAHSMANPLTARYDMVHGQAVGMALPTVLRFNACEPLALHHYQSLVVRSGLLAQPQELDAVVPTLLTTLGKLIKLAGFPKNLSAAGVSEEDVPALAESAAKQWTANFNPRAIKEADFLTLYRSALHEPLYSEEN